MSDTLIVSPADVAVRLGQDPAALTQAQTDYLTAKIEDAESDVLAYLNRDSLVAVETIAKQQYPVFGAPDLSDWRAWPRLLDLFDDRVAVKSWVDNGDGTYDVTVLVGLDGANEAPVRRFVLAHAVESTRNDPSNMGLAKRQVTSVSAEGQSISYDKGSSTEGAAGSGPNIKTLARYKRLSAFSRQGPASPPWPYRGGFRGPVGWV